MRATGRIVAVVALALGVGACGGSEDAERSRTLTTSAEADDDGGDDGGRDDGGRNGRGGDGSGGGDRGGVDDGTSDRGGDDDGGHGGTAGADGRNGGVTTPPAGAGSDDGGDPVGTPGQGNDNGQGQSAPANMSSAAICERLPSPTVAAALGVSPVEATPGESPTPQCSYEFTGANGVAAEATIAALRADEDLDGRVGTEAFVYVVDANKALAQGTGIEETVIDAGDQAVLLTGANLHMGVVRVGGRIVTTLVSTAAAGPESATALTQDAATGLAP